MRFIIYILLVISYSLSFGQKAENESIYVHTDKEIYFPGEILWFKVYAVHTEDLTPVNKPSVAYIELTDSRGTSVLLNKAEIGPATRNGGSVFIPQRLSSGTYTLTGATLASETGGRSFSKKITVLNPFAIQDTLSAPPENTYTIRLFPEGGTLVRGIPTRIAFKVTDAQGKGVKASLVFPDGTRGNSNAFGIGSARVMPVAGIPVAGIPGGDMPKVKVLLPDGRELGQPLPFAAETGYVLNAEDKGDHYTIQVASAGHPGETLTLVSESSSGKAVKYMVILNASGSASHLIPRAQLPEGTSRLTLLRNDGTPVAERILFRAPEKTLRLNLALNRQTFSGREEITLSLNQVTPDPAIIADVSVSIKKEDDLQRPSGENIRSYLYLRKDLSGEIENPDYYFSDAETGKADLDNLLLTHGWRKFKNQSAEEEGRYHRIGIRFTGKTDGQPLAGREATLSVPSRIPMIYTAVTDTNGVAYFWVKNVYGTHNLVTRLTSGELSHAEILKFRSEAELFSPADLTGISQNSYNEYAINAQVENIFSGKNRTAWLPPATLDSLPFFGKADVRYRLDDYTRFVIMEEVLREYVKEVMVRKNRDDFRLRTQDVNRNTFFNSNPLILLDGVPVPHPNDLMAYDPLKVETVDVITSRFYLGESVHDGIVSFSTYKGVLENFTLDPSFSVFTYEGLQPEREFYVPEVPGTASVPDNRTVLYWTPRLMLSGEESRRIKFSSSDLSGEYVVDVQGIDSSGKPGSQTLRFSVK